MSVIKRAVLYVTRKWQQSLIIYFVLLTVSTSALMGAAILRASDSAASNLRQRLGGTFSMEIDKSNSANMKNWNLGSGEGFAASYYAGPFLDHAVIDEVMKTSGITGYGASIESVAKLKTEDGEYCNLLDNSQNYFSPATARIAAIHGWNSLERCSYFANHYLEITQGKMFTGDTAGQAVISRDLAELNHIALGDRLTLVVDREVVGIDIPVDKQQCAFEVVGIFDINGEQQTDRFISRRQMLENWVFVDSQSLLQFLNIQDELFGVDSGYQKVTFSVNDPAEMDSVISRVQQNKAIDWSCFKIAIDNTNYESAEGALSSMDYIVRVMILAISIAGTGILILLLSIWAKLRIYETGILLSMGKGKWNILVQRIAEAAFIMVLAFGSAYIVSRAAGDDVGNMLLAQSNEQTGDGQDSEAVDSRAPISATSIDLTPVFSAPRVEKITVDIAPDNLIAVYATELSVILLCVCVAGIPVMRMKPKEILTKYE